MTDKNSNTANKIEKSPITTHVLDTTKGLPAKNMHVEAFFRMNTKQVWQSIGTGQTNEDGRIDQLLSNQSDFKKGYYKIQFNTEDYFEKDKREFFYPVVDITFYHKGSRDHYHIPLLISPYGYSTYRGS